MNKTFRNPDVHRPSLGDTGPLTDSAAFRAEIVSALIRHVGKHPENAAETDWFEALARVLRGRLAARWLETKRLMREKDIKAVYYLSMEFLIGRSLKTHLLNLGLEDTARTALAGLGIDLDALCETEMDAALGNGGLGRLAACFLDSLTTLGHPAYGYGIRYDHGMFAQGIENGWQVERPEGWLRHGNPWEFPRPRTHYRIGYGGHVTHREDGAHWIPERDVHALAYDLQVSGYNRDMVNTIRLWSARSPSDVDLDLGYFNAGDHVGAVRGRAETEALSRVLYPDDSTEQGRELRLRQEYFFVSASIQDILARYLETHDDFDLLPDKIAIQLNDTHPALAIPELLRLLLDQHGLLWNKAFSLVQRVFAYTNHTLLPEALESWPVDLLARYLPRHLDIIYRMNEDFLKNVASRFPNDHDLLRRLSIIDENGERRVRMAHIAFIGSHKVNGVSELHTKIMRANTFADFDRVFPGRIICKTNGITMRRWLNQSNPGLAALIANKLKADWPSAGSRLEHLCDFIDDEAFKERFTAVKTANKMRLAACLDRILGIIVDPQWMFDIQVKRIHEYKRQLLNLLHVIARYNRIRNGQTDGMMPRVVIFGGKAAASYHMAKLIIKLIHDVAARINADPLASPWLKVVFVPNYNVSLAETIIPAADLSEQISTAGAEASGTGNMKFALNGALTIGTRDGANIEIGEAVGEDNIFFFGLNADDVARKRQKGYNPHAIYNGDAELKRVLDMIYEGEFSPLEPHILRPVVDALLDGGDYFMLLADFRSYMDTQLRIDAAYRDHDAWTKKAMINVANMGRFSSDRTISQYASDIWNVKPVS